MAKSNDPRSLQFVPYELNDRKVCCYGPTLIVCPATLIDQWCREFNKFVASGYIRILKFHGVNREHDVYELATSYDVVITSYNMVVSEYRHSSQSALFRIKWDRIIADEAHVIRNHKSTTNISVCALEASSYWCLTGTPVQNKEVDVYSLIKFLHCHPFQEYEMWRLFMASRKTGTNSRLQALLKSLLLRRTKEELADAGKIERLPTKNYIESRMTLSEPEQKVHDAFMSISRAIFIRYLEQRIEKHPELAYKYRDIIRNAKVDVQKLHEKFVKIATSKVIRHHHIFTILLRLRQICLHPSLIHTSLEDAWTKKEKAPEDDSDEEDDGPDVKSQKFDLMGGIRKLIALNEKDEDGIEQEFGAEAERIKVLSKTNPVFQPDFKSTKMIQMMEMLKDKMENTNDKIILVCSFTGFFNNVRSHLQEENIEHCELTGKVRIDQRDAIVADFNNENSAVRVMLLSLTAGGVGLNLVGANQMIILDLHWNPQWEMQVKDRIHRFGQKKEVHISK